MGFESNKYKINNTDLSTMIDTNHKSAIIETTTLPNFKQNGQPVKIASLTLTYVSSSDRKGGYMSGFDLSPYYKDNKASSMIALKAGYCPLGGNNANYRIFSWEASGESKQWFRIIRSNTTLSIQAKTSATSGWVTQKAYDTTSFPQGVIPYRVYVEIQAAGGAGGNGNWNTASGGGGGGAFWAGVLTTESTNISIYMGAHGEHGSGESDGTSADNCKIEGPSPNASEGITSLITIGGGKQGGYASGGGVSNPRQGGTVETWGGNTYFSPYIWTVTSINGQNGGKATTAGGTSSKSTWTFTNLFPYNTYATSGNSGGTGGAGQPNNGGGGGGASASGDGGMGGDGRLGSNRSGRIGGLGAGGGGAGQGGGVNPSGGNGGNWRIFICY